MPGVLLSVSFTVFTVFITAFQGMYDHPQSSGKKTEGLVNIGPTILHLFGINIYRGLRCQDFARCCGQS